MTTYSPVGDLIVIITCFVIGVLLAFSYKSKNKSYRIFIALIILLIGACYMNVIDYTLVTVSADSFSVQKYLFRIFYHALLFSILFLFVLYITEVVNLFKEQKKRFVSAAGAIWIAVIVADILQSFMTRSVVITQDGIVSRGVNIFAYGYIALVVLIIALLFVVRKMLFRRVMYGFYGTMGISFLVLLLQGTKGNTSFTTATFLFPIIGMFYIIHSNPYDMWVGALDPSALEDTVRELSGENKPFVFMSLRFTGLNEEGKDAPEKVRILVRRHTVEVFRQALMFRVSKGHLLLVYEKKKNPGYKEKIKSVMENFYSYYDRFRLNYKVVIGESIEGIDESLEYLRLIEDIEAGMPEDDTHFVTPEDVEHFRKDETVREALKDIYQKKDLNDPRVLAYCQPVYNIRTGSYDTAEALMRLKLPDLGMVFPDQFIPIAEESGFIHVLTEIILYKTCMAIRHLMEEQKKVSRISVNVSALELRDEEFCGDIRNIITQSGVPCDKVAIELTESRNDSDFLLMKDRICELKKIGIIFYLDDFGTGYSNMERILDMPFDIIKFDRSLVLASNGNERSREMVASLAGMFDKMKYCVLYEGVEDETDEKMCTDMKASYLQGYKYSRPIPIEQLDRFLSA